MGYIKAPDGMRYLIHGHDGNDGKEREPHVHIDCGGYMVSIAIRTGEIIAGGLERDKQRKANDWVRENRYELLEEWNQKLSDSCRY